MASQQQQQQPPSQRAALVGAAVLGTAAVAWRLARWRRRQQQQQQKQEEKKQFISPPTSATQAQAQTQAEAQTQARRQADLLAAREAWTLQRREQRGAARAKPIPVTLVTGELGSGKTTLIRSVLESVRDFSLGVIVNDFAALNVDHDAIARDAASIRQAPGALVKPEVIELSNGCICCSLSSGLADAVRAMLDATAETGVDYILIETSGLTDPAAIVRVVEQEMRGAVRLDAVVLLTDADRWQHALQHTELGIADVVLLNKSDLFADDETKKTAVDAIRAAAAGRARVVPCQFSNVPLEQVLDVVRLAPEREAFGRIVQGKQARERLGAYAISDEGGNLQVRTPPSDAGSSPHAAANAQESSNAWSSFVFHADQAFSLSALQTLVLDDAGAMSQLARLKGTATFVEAPARAFDFQISGMARLSLVPRPSRRVASARCDLAAVVQGSQTIADALRDALGQAASIPLENCAKRERCLADVLDRDPNWQVYSARDAGVCRARLCGARTYGMSPKTLVRKFAIDLDAANLTFIKSINASGARVLALPDFPSDADAPLSWDDHDVDCGNGVGIVLANFTDGPHLQRCLVAVEAAMQTAFSVDFASVKHCRCD